MAVTIYKGTTWIRVRCNMHGYIDETHDIGYFIKTRLRQREWNPKFNCFTTTYNFSRFQAAEGYGYLPRYALDPLLEYLNDPTVKVEDVPPVEAQWSLGRTKMKPQFELRPHQHGLYEFLTEKDRSFAPLSAACGQGKTLVSTAAAIAADGPILLVLGLLIDQWIKSFLTHTTLKREELYVCQGFESIKNLWEMLDNGFKPKLVIFSTRTLVLYAIDRPMPYNQIRTYQDLQKKIGFTTKIIDECHLNFYANVQIDLCSNIARNIYLSATYSRSDYQGKAIFDMVYPPEVRYGEELAEKYTSVLIGQYHLQLAESVLSRFKREKGYLHALYEKYLLQHPKSYLKMFEDEILIPLMDQFYFTIKKPGQRLLILCKTRKFVEALTAYLAPICKQHKANLSLYFAGERGKAGKQENLLADVIISTTNSCSTGVDIKGLKTCINTVSFASEPLAAQTMGRLRKIPNEETIFIDLWNGEIPTHKYHIVARRNVYRRKALNVTEVLVR